MKKLLDKIVEVFQNLALVITEVCKAFFAWIKSWKQPKAPKPPKRYFVIPDDQLKNFCTLYDAAKAGGSYEHIALWVFIAHLYPETAVGTWRCGTSTLKAYVQEV